MNVNNENKEHNWQKYMNTINTLLGESNPGDGAANYWGRLSISFWRKIITSLTPVEKPILGMTKTQDKLVTFGISAPPWYFTAPWEEMGQKSVTESVILKGKKGQSPPGHYEDGESMIALLPIQLTGGCPKGNFHQKKWRPWTNGKGWGGIDPNPIQHL